MQQVILFIVVAGTVLVIGVYQMVGIVLRMARFAVESLRLAKPKRVRS